MRLTTMATVAKVSTVLKEAGFDGARVTQAPVGLLPEFDKGPSWLRSGSGRPG